MVRWFLRGAVTASVLLVAAHFAYTITTFRTLTLQSVQFAELGLPLLFAACLNGVVWSALAPSRAARATAHFVNLAMIGVAVLVARFAPLPPAYLVLACAAALGLVGLIADRRGRSEDAGITAAPAAQST